MGGISEAIVPAEVSVSGTSASIDGGASPESSLATLACSNSAVGLLSN